MKNPLVSIIVPNYNYAQYLDERMESILSQTYQNFEVIILDDKSTDNSLEVIERYKSHPKVSKVIINETNSGSPFIQWERGINEATGEIIWIAESDDYCSPDFLETLVPLYVKNDAVLAFCHSELVDEKGQKLRENDQMNSVSSDFSMDGKEFIKKYLAHSNEVQNASCAIFSKKVALGIDKQYMNYKGAGDWLFWINLAEKGKVCYASKSCNSYRLHSNTTSKVVRSGLEFREMKTIYEWLLKYNYLDEKQFQRCKLKNISLISSLDEIPHEIKKGLFQMWGITPQERFFLFAGRLKGLIMLLLRKALGGARFLKGIVRKCLVTSWLLFENSLLRIFLRRPRYNKKYKVCICGIFKNEAPFLKEWIEFHEMIGIEHFYLYNNNSEDDYLNVLQPYISRGLVTLIDWPYSQAQIKAYQHFYETYRYETQWVSFLDIDEFFCPRYDSSLQEWLKKNDKYPVLLVYWKMFGSSGKLKHDNNQLVIEQYTVSWDFLYHTGKCLVNTDFDIKSFNVSTHHQTKIKYPLLGRSFYLTVSPANQFGLFVDGNWHLSWLYNEKKSPIQVNHYWSKAWDVYDKKRKMTDVYFKKNPKQEMWYFYAHERQNRSVDYSMARFFIQFKLKLGLYEK